MAFNKFMHPRNIYKDNPPNFQHLAETFGEFKKFCYVDLAGRITIDFKNPDAVRALTHALLKNDFDLDVELPSDSLVPRIPLRLNYILWLEDIVRSFPAADAAETISGVDIGTGASCIYPLLGSKLYGWNFVATDRDGVSVEFARRNVERNKLRDCIEVLKVGDHTALCGVVDQFPDRQFDFCMCNPPFFDIKGEMQYLASASRPGRPEPHSATVAKIGEVCAEGGEVSFVSSIIDDSVKLGKQIRIYTSMIGRKASLAPLKAKLREAMVRSMCDTTFCQGKTQRWAVAWTFDADINLKVPKTQPKKKRDPLLFTISTAADYPGAFELSLKRVLSVMKELEITCREIQSNKRSALSQYVCFSAVAVRNTWSHSRRKRRALKRIDESSAKVAKLDGNDAGVSYEATSAENSNQSGKQLSDQLNGARESGHNDETSKKRRSADEASFVIKFSFTVKQWDTRIVMEMQHGESDDADSLHQISQFCKNRLQTAADGGNDGKGDR